MRYVINYFLPILISVIYLQSQSAYNLLELIYYETKLMKI